MPKFANGEFALLQGIKNCKKGDAWIHAYDGTVVQVVNFIAHTEGSNHLDWYIISLEDDRQAYARETVLHKLPDEYSPGDMRVIEELMNKKRNEVTCE